MQTATHAAFDEAHFQRVGLNLCAVQNIHDMPRELTDWLTDHERSRYSQLLLLGHGGRAFWQALQSSSEWTSAMHPVDQFTTAMVESHLAAQAVDHRMVYPGQRWVDLQALGRYVGWQQETPFLLGMHAQWGSWFAYRSLVLMASSYTPTARIVLPALSHCDACVQRPCVSACPAHAISNNDFSIARCVAYRQQPQSRCADTCLARAACPVAKAHQYSAQQMAYHYGQSRQMLFTQSDDLG